MPTILKPQKIPPSFFQDRRDTAIAWLGMAGLLVNSRGKIMMIDPLLTLIDRDGEGGQRWSETHLRMLLPELPLETDGVKKLDLVMYTHAEDDHFGTLTPGTLEQRFKPIFMGPPPVLKRLREMSIPEERLRVANDFELSTICGTTIEVTPALHDHDKVNPWKRGDCVGYILRTPDGSIWHPGDTGLIPELLNVKNIDILLWDASVEVPTHLGPDGTAAIAKTCGAKLLLPYHYGTFEATLRNGNPAPTGPYRRALQSDPEQSLPFAKTCPGRFVIIQPGEVLTLPLP
ncbi:MAG: MBL fold metallo-hydrolase [Phycisphaerales bacterium]|nr:MBL fold metallo-hydrolase [Phycisphaerales bacterium]